MEIISIEENNRRLAELKKHYDPITGEGSLTDRVKCHISCPDYGIDCDFYLPTSMNISGHHILSGVQFDDLMFEREAHDFEYWCVLKAIIKDKETSRAINFKLNRAQRRLVQSLERQRLKRIPIRIIVLKARQWGGSTSIQFYIIWLQTKIQPFGWNSCIAAHQEGPARNVRAMINNTKKSIGITLMNFEGSSKVKTIVEHDCTISIGSAERPDGIRSESLKACHVSEAGLMKTTKGKSPDDLIQSLRGAMADVPDSFFAVESTAKGIGNFFHNEYTRAKNKESDYEAFFMPWFEIPIYTKKIKGDITAFIKSLSAKELSMWNLGATLEGINWYRSKFKELMNNEIKMGQEFPSTEEEAFSSTGNPYIPLIYIQRNKWMIRKPEFVGDIFAPVISGKECVKNMEFAAEKNGRFQIWSMPDNKPIANRYTIPVDVGGRSENADDTVITVIDRYWKMFGEPKEVVARWRGKLDHDLAAWKALQIAMFYNKGLLIPETNFYDNKEKKEGNHFLTVVTTIGEIYDNMYIRTPLDKIKEGAPVTYGFHTNRETKPLVCEYYLACVRDGRIIDPDEEAHNQQRQFEIKTDGKLGAVEKAHDDIFMCTAIGNWVSDYKQDNVFEITKSEYKRRLINSASI